ncbi:unnamed protein product, partial [Prorocentrum cordatum]
EFYLQRLAKAEPAAAARLGAGAQGALTAGELGQTPFRASQVRRPTFTRDVAEQGEEEDLEIMCNNCFTLIRSSEAAEHGNTCFFNLSRLAHGGRARAGCLTGPFAGRAFERGPLSLACICGPPSGHLGPFLAKGGGA